MKTNKYRRKSEREAAIKKVSEVHHRKDMTLDEKIAYAGATSKSDYKHLARDGKISAEFKDKWDPYKDQFLEIAKEAVRSGLATITYLKANYPEVYKCYLEEVSNNNLLVVKRAAERFNALAIRELGVEPKKVESIWKIHEVQMLKVIEEQRNSSKSLHDILKTKQFAALFQELLANSSGEAAVIDALRKLSQKTANGIVLKSRRTPFWSKEEDLMLKVQACIEDSEEPMGVIRALKVNYPDDYKRLSSTRSDSSINHAFQSFYLRKKNESCGFRKDSALSH